METRTGDEKVDETEMATDFLEDLGMRHYREHPEGFAWWVFHHEAGKIRKALRKLKQIEKRLDR
jgi:hypothetical protein